MLVCRTSGSDIWRRPSHNQCSKNEHADDIDPSAFDNGINDDVFAKLVACIRISVPYRDDCFYQKSKCRERVLHLGVSQVSGGSKTSVGGYDTPEAEDDDSSQFDVADTRSVDEIIKWLMELGYIPSFVRLVIEKAERATGLWLYASQNKSKNCCHPNALITLKEYLEDYASEATQKIGEDLISKEIDNIPNEKTRGILKKIWKVSVAENVISDFS